MWPVLETSLRTLTTFLASDAHELGAELPGKSFTMTPGFEGLQSGSGPLTHAFRLGGTHGRRMVMPYQAWMLQRLVPVVESCTSDPVRRHAIEEMLGSFPGNRQFLDLERSLRGCRIRKDGGRLFSVPVSK
jgi:hypothetical protein